MNIEEAMGEIEPRHGKNFDDFVRWAMVGARCGNPWFAADKLGRAWRSLLELPANAMDRARQILELANRERESESRPSWWKDQYPSVDVSHELFLLGWERKEAFGVAT